MNQPSKVIPVDMDPPSAPTYDQLYNPQMYYTHPQQPMYEQNQPNKENKIAEWWNWILLRKHAPGSYYEQTQSQQQPYTNPEQYQQPSPYQQYPHPQYQPAPQYSVPPPAPPNPYVMPSSRLPPYNPAAFSPPPSGPYPPGWYAPDI